MRTMEQQVETPPQEMSTWCLDLLETNAPRLDLLETSPRVSGPMGYGRSWTRTTGELESNQRPLEASAWREEPREARGLKSLDARARRLKSLETSTHGQELLETSASRQELLETSAQR